MRLKNIVNLAVATAVSLSSLMVMVPGVVHAAGQAATLYWTGAGTDQNFSTVANWNTLADGTGVARIPLAADVLEFPAVATNRAPVNDQTGVVLNGINFSGVSGTCGTSLYDWFDITGTALLINNTIENNMTGDCSSVLIDTDITASGSGALNFTGDRDFNLGSVADAHTLNLGSKGANLNGTTDYATVTFESKLIGSGAINANNSLVINGDSSGYTGVISISGSNYFNANENSKFAGSVVIGDLANMAVTICDGTTFTTNITLNGGVGTLDVSKLYVYGVTCPAPTSTGGLGAGAGAGQSYDEYYVNGGMPSDGSITLAGNLTLGADQTVFSGAKTLNVKSTLVGAFKLTPTKGSGGTVVVASDNNTSLTPNGSYSPAPEVDTLSDNSTASVLVSGNYVLTIDGQRGDTTVEGGAILNGTGKVGKLTVNSPGIVAPGHSPGCITSGDLAQKGTYQVQLGGADPCTGYDQLQVTGTVTIDSTTAALDVSNFGDFKPTKDQNFIIISNDGSDAVSGTFKGLDEGGTFVSNGNSYKITYKGGDGNDVVITFLSVGAPNTGFSLITASPLMTMIATSFAAGALLIASSRSKRSIAKR